MDSVPGIHHNSSMVSRASASHPTRERLIDTVVTMLDGDHPDKINVEDVLLQSGISKGSLYHHFTDFNDLIESAFVRRFTRTVDGNIEAIATLVTQADSKASFVEGLHRITEQSQAVERAPFRFERARALGMAGWNPRFRESLGAEQRRLTEALTDLFREAQHKGWLNQDFDPHAAAVFIQAYTLGQVVNDIDEQSMSREAWNSLIHSIVENVFS
jgi:AcrR family transcriptional regulator